MKISRRAFPGLVILLTVFLFAAVSFSATIGFLKVPFADVLTLLLTKIRHVAIPGNIDQSAAAVVMDVRIPRILCAVLVGGMLGISGTIFQAILLNPLADSYTLGISTGAAFGASLNIVLKIFGLVLPPAFSVPLFAFAGGAATLFAVLSLAAGDRRLSSSSLILAGIIVSAILSAAVGFLKFLADEQVGIIIFWIMGSLVGSSWKNIMMLVPVALAGTAIAIAYSRDLNVMTGGDRLALSLGVNIIRLRTVLLVVGTLLTSCAVSASGIIGFVGLIVPHLLRNLVGPDNRQLIPLSFFAGGLLLLFADTLTRAVLPREIPIGVLTALLGGPFFCLLFKKRQREGDHAV